MGLNEVLELVGLVVKICGVVLTAIKIYQEKRRCKCLPSDGDNGAFNGN